MSYNAVSPHWGLKKENHKVHTKMYAISGARMTCSEDVVWVNGDVDGDDGWTRGEGQYLLSQDRAADSAPHTDQLANSKFIV